MEYIDFISGCILKWHLILWSRLNVQMESKKGEDEEYLRKRIKKNTCENWQNKKEKKKRL